MSFGKHFINDVPNPVEHGLRSLLLQHNSLRLIESEKVLHRQPSPTSKKVVLLSGGGAGHEPAHVGYLGEGMLDICVVGQIFASPSASQVLAGMKALDSPSGVLVIVNNYTGDKLNFGLAAQKAKGEGIKVNTIFVGDDISVKSNNLVGRRGLAGVVLVNKIAGAAALAGATLDEVTAIAQSAAENVYTVGVSLDRCSVPGREMQDSLPFDKLEYGMGIHNEPGARRDRIGSLSTVVSNVLSFFSRSILNNPLPVALMVNNLGGLSYFELNVIAEEVMAQFSKCSGIDIRRIFVGTFTTSLDGPGFSVTLLKLLPGFDEFLDAKTTAPAWPNQTEPVGNINDSYQRVVASKVDDTYASGEKIFSVDTVHLRTILEHVVSSVTEAEPKITKYDTLAGDGDCGETLLRGVRLIQEKFYHVTSNDLDLVNVFHIVATIVENGMGGTSGAIYAIFFNSLANSLSSNLSRLSDYSSVKTLFSVALPQALNELCQYTSARKGHRTLMDALIPFVETFESTKDLEAAIVESQNGVEATRKLDAVLGRASYVAKENFSREEHDGIPDPGALGVVSILRGIGATLR